MGFLFGSPIWEITIPGSIIGACKENTRSVDGSPHCTSMKITRIACKARRFTAPKSGGFLLYLNCGEEKAMFLEVFRHFSS